jgi:imidazolonepropionase
MAKLIGPFSEIITMTDVPEKGAIRDFTVLKNGGIVIQDDKIIEVGDFSALHAKNDEIIEIESDHVLLPGLIDCHTHMCFGGSRAGDYALRVGGKTYQEILKNGGGIHDTVNKTRNESQESLKISLIQRAERHLSEGVTTCEVKSGYGLSLESELKILRAIKEANQTIPSDLISTCLAAHVCPKEFDSPKAYLEHIVADLFPILIAENLTNRIDVFVEDGAFDPELTTWYLGEAKKAGFELTLHADQFSSGGSEVAVNMNALSADHLEASSEEDVKRLADSDVVCTVLPGASLGLGMHYSSARNLLDHGCCVAISTDWNPGSAPMGDLLIQTALLGAAEKLSIGECIAGITTRAAKALNLSDRGKLASGLLADMIAFPTHDHQEIFYQQGKMKPDMVWKKGLLQ